MHELQDSNGIVQVDPAGETECTGARVEGRPEIQCAAPMGKGHWCRRRTGHEGGHHPDVRYADDEANAQPQKRVLVTGSRDWADDYLIWMHLDTLRTESFVLVHGKCSTGADRHADDWAANVGNPVERHPADWSQGRKAGPQRNAEMVALGADLCLAYIGPCTSPRCPTPRPHASHGATGCADLAETAGIETRRYFAPSLIRKEGA